MYFLSPLEQFEIITLSNYFFLSNLTITFVLLLLIFNLFTYQINFKNFLYSINQIIFEKIILFIRRLFLDMFGFKLTNNIFISFPLFVFLFFILLFWNLSGLFLFSYTISSQFIIVLFFSFTFFMSFNLISIRQNKTHFFSLFLPNNTPLFLIPLLIPIEIISYIARIFSLSIRLFANMVAGHALLKILSGFCIALITSTIGILNSIALLSSILILCIIGLEIMIAVLQAYIFIILNIIYYSQAVFIDH
jgi:F-type H+-transporting ATPase subunit a